MKNKTDLSKTEIQIKRWTFPGSRSIRSDFAAVIRKDGDKKTLVFDRLSLDAVDSKLAPSEYSELIDKSFSKFSIGQMIWEDDSPYLFVFLESTDDKSSIEVKKKNFIIQVNPVICHRFDRLSDDLWFEFKIKLRGNFFNEETIQSFKFFVPTDKFKDYDSLEKRVFRSIGNLKKWIKVLMDNYSLEFYRDSVRKATASNSYPDGFCNLKEVPNGCDKTLEGVAFLLQAIQKYGYNTVGEISNLGILFGWLKYYDEFKKPKESKDLLTYATYGWGGTKFIGPFSSIFLHS
jgi:hypothetical protein